MSEILLLTATGFEQADIAGRLEERVEQEVAGKLWRTGRVDQRQVRLVETGIGAVNAAHALTCALQMGSPDLVLQTGVGGAYLSAGLEIGDVALANEENYGDLGVRTGWGWRSAKLIGIPVLMQDGLEFFNRFPLEHEWVRQATRILKGVEWDGEVQVGTGPFVTVQECSGTPELGAEREACFEGICESMEGAAVAHLCRLYDVPFLEVRGISNLVEERRRHLWNLPLAAARAQRAACSLIEKLNL